MKTEYEVPSLITLSKLPAPTSGETCNSTGLAATGPLCNNVGGNATGDCNVTGGKATTLCNPVGGYH
ncbi:MAG: hypothetical protein NT099_09410 [Candidatus Saganbacteria bacterium]|nr:hypothetical protein [Candidatus Saganbacteria bacterium]